MYILGIDGGGTKTQVIVADQTSKVLSVFQGGPTYLRSVSLNELSQTLETAILGACRNASISPDQIFASCFGIAGYDHESDLKFILDAINSFHQVRLSAPLIVNDVVCALRRGTANSSAVVIISGTGSHAYGKNESGEEAHSGGLGHLLSDEGSGYFIGNRVLHAAAKSYDGRASKTILETLVCKKFNVSNLRDVLPAIHDECFGKNGVASLSLLCDQAAVAGDAVAAEILANAAEELVLMVSTVVTRLNLEGANFDLVCVGGSFESLLLKTKFEEGLRRMCSPTIVYPQNEPAMGAVLLALDNLNRKKTQIK